MSRARPSTLRSRVLRLPPPEPARLYPHQVEAVEKLEHSLKQNKPRSLVQMATGSGKTIFAITSVYRLIKHAEARRVLFLVDRKNLGEQAEKEFQAYRTPDDNRKLTELYNVQRLASNTIMDSSRVVITTIQRSAVRRSRRGRERSWASATARPGLCAGSSPTRT